MKKKLLALALCLVLMIAPLATVGAFAANADGYTLDGKTYTVTTADGLLAVAAAVNGGNVDYNITLAADIDLAGKVWTPIGTTKNPYEGTFDGGNFTISNLTLTVNYQEVGVAGHCGLIGKAYDGCTVKNVNFTGAAVQGVEFSALVISETAQKDAAVLTKKVVIDNVHIRNSTIKGSNGWGKNSATVDKNEYTGALIGKAGAHYTEINNCSVVATITSECRTGGLLGGESAPSKLDTTGITITNCIVGGAVTQAKLPTGSNTVKAGGAAGIIGYHSTIPAKIENCVVFATLGAENGPVGVISFNTNKLSLEANNIVMNGAAFGKVNDVSMGTTAVNNIFVYKLGETAATVALATDLNSKDAEKLKVNGTETTWADATATVISDKEALRTRINTMYATNTVINDQIIDDVIGHDHAFTNEVVDAKFLKSAATCTAKAVYYKSCSCGIPSADATFETGELVAHAPSDKWTNDDNNHWHVCASCLENKSDEAAHTFGDWTVTKEATEIRQGERTKACTVCGHEVTEKIDPISAKDTDKDDDTAAATATGCGSAIVGMGTVLVATLGMGVTVLKKKVR